MPSVKVGSVLDVTYTIESPFLFTLPTWYFQETIPVRKSEYNVTIPEYFNYKNWVSGYIIIKKESETFDRTYQYNKAATIDHTGRQSGEVISLKLRDTRWNYSVENIPAFINEPYITTPYDYLATVDFELISTNYPGQINKYYSRTWEDINRELLEDYDFGKQLNNNDHLKELSFQITGNTSDPMMKMISAYELIKKSISWNSRYSIWVNETLRKAFKENKGTSGDINLNLVALCRMLDLDANPVLVSTRNHGKIRPGQVILTQFNHVIACVRIGEKMYLFDAINPNCPFFMLPPNTLNGQGMMISEKGYQWIDLYSNLPSNKVAFIQSTIDEELNMKGQIQENLENFYALDARADIKSLINSDEYVKQIEQKYNGLLIDSITIENLDSINKPLKIRKQFSIQDHIVQGGDRIYFNPLLFNQLTENPFKNDDRKFPVDFNYPILTKMTTIIKLPDGYVVEELPQPIIIVLPNNNGKYAYNIKVVGNNLTMVTEFSINQTVFPTENYVEIKKLYELRVAKESEQVVLKKTN